MFRVWLPLPGERRLYGSLAWLKPDDDPEGEDVLVWQPDGLPAAAERISGVVTVTEVRPEPLHPQGSRKKAAVAFLRVELGSNAWSVYNELPVTAQKVVTKQMALNGMPNAKAAGFVIKVSEEE